MHTTRGSTVDFPSQGNQAGDGLDISTWIGYFWEKKWVFIWAALVFGLIGTILSFTLTHMYSATATVLVEDPPNVIPGQGNALKDVYSAPEALKAVEGSFKSDTLLLRLVKNNHLDLIHPAFQARPGDSPMDDAKLIQVMNKRFSAKTQRGSRLIDIQVEDEDPALAQKLTQSAVNEYIKLMYGSAGQVVSIANAELERQAEQIRQKLEKSEQQLQAYREQYNTTSIEEKKNLSQEKLGQLNQQLADAKASRIRLESQVGSITKVDSTPLSRLWAIQSIASQPDVGALQKSLGDAEAQLAQARKTYGPLHPAYQSLESAVASLRGQLDKVVRNYARALINEYKSATATEANLTKQIGSIDRESVELAGISIPYAMIEREEQANKSMYDQLLGRMRQNTVEQNVNQMNIQQVQNPVLPNINLPSKPKPILLIAVGVIGGLMLAFGYVVLRRATDSSLRSIDEAERILQMAALATIPLAKPRKGLKGKQSVLLQANDPASHQAESIRDLRTALAHLPTGQPRSILFTSSVPGEGKSFCAANYAVALAHQGLRTLLIDGDLRRPTLSEVMGAAAGRPGLADYLSARAQLNDICHQTAIDNLALVSAGTHRSKPAELLSQKKAILTLLQSLVGYDCIVIDSAPILAASDPLLLAPTVETVVLVVRAYKTQQREMVRSIQLLHQVGAQIAGFVLNQLPLQRSYSYPEYADTSKAV